MTSQQCRRQTRSISCALRASQ